MIELVGKLGRAESTVVMVKSQNFKIFDFLADPVLIIGEDKVIIYANKAEKQSHGDFSGKFCHQLFRTSFDPCPYYQNKAIFKRGTIRWEWNDRDGQVFDIIDNPFILEDGTSCRIRILRNVTEKKGEEKAEKNRTRKELERKEYQLQQAIQKSINAQEEERKRISRELHDGVGQLLTALKINLVGMQDNPRNIDQSKLDKAVDMVSSSIRELRRISLDLRPPMLDELGFVSTLYWLIDRFQQSSDIQVGFFPHSFPKDASKQVELALFRVVQEALSNVERHAQATQVRVSMSATEFFVELEISDNGIGFDPDQAFQNEDLGNGIGLVSMHERIEALGGGIQVRSTPKKGTTIQIKVPIKRARKT